MFLTLNTETNVNYIYILERLIKNNIILFQLAYSSLELRVACASHCYSGCKAGTHPGQDALPSQGAHPPHTPCLHTHTLTYTGTV